MECVIFVGIQAAGKTSFYREQFFETHLRLSMDMLRTRHRERLLFAACLEAKQRVVIDNTNLTVADRARYIALAHAARFVVVGYFFEAQLDDALRRNVARPSRQVVPEKGVRGAAKRLEPPSPAEGFDLLRRVAITEGGGFNVQEWGDAF